MRIWLEKCNFLRVGLEPGPITWTWDKLQPPKFVPICQTEKRFKLKTKMGTHKNWLHVGGSFALCTGTHKNWLPLWGSFAHCTFHLKEILSAYVYVFKTEHGKELSD